MMTNESLSLPNFVENIYFFNEGNHRTAYEFLGSQKVTHGSQDGYQFSVWAPNAAKVYVQGDFSEWATLEMTRYDGGVWTLFVPNAKKGDFYKYGIDNGRGHIEFKMDPFAFKNEIAPKDSSVVWDNTDFNWSDGVWMHHRSRKNWYEEPIQIYEVHMNSWRKHPDGTDYSFEDLAEELIPYVKEMGYTHIEFMPLTDHPLDASWGYQTTGYYSVCGRYGTLDEFKAFVNQAHKEGVGVFMDWVPGHFSRNANALAYFDGTPTFEYQDVNRADNRGWGALNFDLGKTQVQSFLISNALFWLKECHLDGLRVDAVSSILYLDFDEGPWTPNEDGSNHSREGVAFIKKLNKAIKEELPDVLIMAEESTDWQGITHPLEEGGLGFDYKWNMGWMNDTLKFFKMDPLYRPSNLTLITFVFMYQFNERYVLPYSHDEVVHGKDSLLGKVPGDRYQQFATLRTMHGYMLAQPGKKLHFMGNELGQFLEWRYYSQLEWIDLEREYNSEYHHFMKTLNNIGKQYPAFYQLDHSPEGIDILNADDYEEGTLSFIRQGKKPRDFVVVMCNFVPVERQKVRIGVPYKGTYEVLLNSEMVEFGGNWEEDLPDMRTDDIEYDGHKFSIEVTVPSLSVLYIKPKRVYGVKK